MRAGWGPHGGNAYDYDNSYDWMTPDDYDLLFLGRYAFQWNVVTPELVTALHAYNAAGGNLITEWDGLSLLGRGYHPTFRYAAGAPGPMGWFNFETGGGQFLASNTPVTVTAPGDRAFPGVASPMAGGGATEFFFTVYPIAGGGPLPFDTLATFPGNGSVNFPAGDHATILRGARCGGNVVILTFDLQDDAAAPAFDPFLQNLVAEGLTPPPIGTVDTCP